MNNEYLPQEVVDFLSDLLNKASVTNEKTESHANLRLSVGDFVLPARVDDVQLFTLGVALLPNIVNYLLNILPQFLYPYIVAYLQDLSNYREDPFTINELFDLIKDLTNEHVHNDSDSQN